MLDRPKPILPLDERLAETIAASSIERTAHSRHDAIVVGAGAAGGMAAALLCEAGMRVLCLDATNRTSVRAAPLTRLSNALVRVLSDPATRRRLPPTQVRMLEDTLTGLGRRRQPIQSHSDIWALLPDAFIDDVANPYMAEPANPIFYWLRAQLLGGRMALPGHHLQYYRMSPRDFQKSAANPDGWPIRYSDLTPWYDLVEKRIGLAGLNDAAGDIPQSTIRQVTPTSAGETALMTAIRKKWPDAAVMMGQHAKPANLLGEAAATGYLLCRTGAVVQRVEVDGRGAVRGVHWFDIETGRMEKTSAPIVFLCASALESTRILMMSGDGGVGAKSGVLGRYLMDHITQKAEGIGPRLPQPADPPDAGRCIYLPQFQKRRPDEGAKQSSFNIQVRQSPAWGGQSWFSALLTAEMPADRSNRMVLDPDRTDPYGAPLMKIHCQRGHAQFIAAAERANALRELADAVGAELHHVDDMPLAPGLAAAECGTARMGADPQDSVLDPNSQCWEAKGLYVTDGAGMVSQGRVGPALTIMALTARACAHALQVSPQETRPKERARERMEKAAQSRRRRAAKSAKPVDKARTRRPVKAQSE